jgi:hypothetical protein
MEDINCAALKQYTSDKESMSSPTTAVILPDPIFHPQLKPKYWLHALFHQKSVPRTGHYDGLSMGKDLDPVARYLRNRVVVPLHMHYLSMDVPAISIQPNVGMESRVQEECQWTQRGFVDGFHVAEAHFSNRNWRILYQLEEESQSTFRYNWCQDHPEYRRYAEGRLPTIMEEKDGVKDSMSAVSTIVSPELTPVSICYNEDVLYKVIVQCHLKEITNLACIPEIHASHAWVGSGPEMISGTGQKHPIEELSWILEDSVEGSRIKVYHGGAGKGSDKIFYQGSKGNWIRLSGRRKERFLDDLARIQVAYSFITFPHLGRLSLHQCSPNEETFFPLRQLDDRVGAVKVDIQPTDSVKDYQTSLGIETDLLPGPYPLQPILPIWDNLLINSQTGKIILLKNSSLAKSVPWEVAAQPPLTMSKKSHAKYVYSLKRHWFGYYIRARQGNCPRALMPRLDQLACHERKSCKGLYEYQ